MSCPGWLAKVKPGEVYPFRFFPHCRGPHSGGKPPLPSLHKVTDRLFHEGVSLDSHDKDSGANDNPGKEQIFQQCYNALLELDFIYFISILFFLLIYIYIDTSQYIYIYIYMYVYIYNHIYIYMNM